MITGLCFIGLVLSYQSASSCPICKTEPNFVWSDPYPDGRHEFSLGVLDLKTAIIEGKPCRDIALKLIESKVVEDRVYGYTYLVEDHFSLSASIVYERLLTEDSETVWNVLSMLDQFHFHFDYKHQGKSVSSKVCQAINHRYKNYRYYLAVILARTPSTEARWMLEEYVLNASFKGKSVQHYFDMLREWNARFTKVDSDVDGASAYPKLPRTADKKPDSNKGGTGGINPIWDRES